MRLIGHCSVDYLKC